MSIRTGLSSDFKIFGLFLMPSWLSLLFALLIAIAIIGGTIVISHFGNDVQQSLLGLHTVYRHSSVGTSVDNVAGKFTHNNTLGNVLFFMSWGLVGLVIYSIAQGIINEFRHADELSHELGYIHVNRRALIQNLAERAALRIGALIALLIMIHIVVYKIVPFGIDKAHVSALHLSNVVYWYQSIFVGVICMLSIHVLVVLLRLVFLRPRFFDSEIVL